ncbi:hypothetical protein CGLAUT_04970 [Corynebacterium glaucum]|nr:hypothetical protein CGLAUT_04970 [Corynebacterium glaucum]
MPTLLSAADCQETTAAFGVSGMGKGCAMIIGNVIGISGSPLSRALWLGIGLTGANMGNYIQMALPICWGFSITRVLDAGSVGLLE